MSAAAEFFGQCGAIELAAAAQADFESALGLFDKDHRRLSAAYRQREVDDIFAVGGQGPGRVKIFIGDVGVNQPAVEFSLRRLKVRPIRRKRARESFS